MRQIPDGKVCLLCGKSHFFRFHDVFLREIARIFCADKVLKHL